MRLHAPSAALSLALLLSAPGRAAGPGEVDQLLVRLDEKARAVTTLAGEFTQKNRIKLFRQEVRSEGRFFFQRPRRVRWEYRAPDPSTLVLDGQVVTLKTPGAPPQTFQLAQDAAMRAVFDQLLLWLGAESLDRAKADYALAAEGGRDAPTLALVPKPSSPVAKAFGRIELAFDRALLLRTIRLRETNGDEKEISFTKLTPNAKLPPDAFAP